MHREQEESKREVNRANNHETLTGKPVYFGIESDGNNIGGAMANFDAY